MQRQTDKQIQAGEGRSGSNVSQAAEGCCLDDRGVRAALDLFNEVHQNHERMREVLCDSRESLDNAFIKPAGIFMIWRAVTCRLQARGLPKQREKKTTLKIKSGLTGNAAVVCRRSTGPLRKT